MEKPCCWFITYSRVTNKSQRIGIQRNKVENNPLSVSTWKNNLQFGNEVYSLSISKHRAENTYFYRVIYLVVAFPCSVIEQIINCLLQTWAVLDWAENNQKLILAFNSVKLKIYVIQLSLECIGSWRSILPGIVNSALFHFKICGSASTSSKEILWTKQLLIEYWKAQKLQ